MIRCSCQGLHGCVPVAPSAIPSESQSASTCERRSASFRAASSKLSQRPVFTSTSEAISSPARCVPSSLPSSRRLDVLEAVDEGERGGIEHCELLLDREREVRALLELLAGEVDLLVRAELLLVAHLPLDGSRRDEAFRSSSLESAQDLGCDMIPAPARDRGAACGRPQARAWSAADSPRIASSFAARSPASSFSKLVRNRSSGRVLGLEPRGDLGEARVARDQRRRAAGGRLGGDHAERLREGGRRDRHVGEGVEVHEVAMLHGAGEQHGEIARLRARAPSRMSPQPTITQRAPTLRQRVDEHMGALLAAHPAHEDHGGPVAREETLQALRVALVRQALIVALGRVRQIQRGPRRAVRRAPPRGAAA